MAFCWQFKGKYLACLCVLSLSACQSVVIDRSEVEDIIPLQWEQELSSSDSDAQLVQQLPWWEFINEPTLRQIVHEALAYNRDLQLAVLRVSEAAATLQLRRAEQWPSVSVDGQSNRSRVPADLSPTQSTVLSADYGLTIGISSWELDLWGRIRHLKDAALEEFLAGSYAQHAVQATVVAEVIRTYLSLQTLDEQIHIAQQSIDSRQESFRIFKRRYELGASSLLELTQVETLLMQARVLLSQLKQERVDLAHALTVLVGKPVNFNAPGTIAQMSGTQGSANSTFKAIALGLPSEVLLQRPDIVAAEHKVKASNANIKAARAAYFPRIALTTAVGTMSSELSGLFEGGSGSWNFSPSISLPIFDGGTRVANLEVARVRAQMAVVDYEKAVQEAFREVSDALNHRARVAEQVNMGQRVVQIQQERARLAQLRYDSGAVNYLEVLDAQRELLTAQQQLAEDRGKLLMSEVELYNALGGGTEIFEAKKNQQGFGQKVSK